MKSLRSIVSAVIPGLAMVILILDAKTALEGAQSGVELCIRTVIPSLFPFLFLSVMVTGSLIGRKIPLLRPLGQLCRIPEGTEGIMAVGLLGGYPVGAQSIAQAYRQGWLSRESAQRMLGFCSNAGPSFIFGILSEVFSGPAVIWILWVIHILSAILTGLLLPGGGKSAVKTVQAPAPSPASALERSIKVMASICGWVVIFRVLLTFCQRWFLWMLPEEAAIAIYGLTELTNGCCRLQLVQSEGLQFVLTSVLLAFGGLCVGLQTVSVTQELGTGFYFPGKVIQTGISGILAFLAQPFLFPEYACAPTDPMMLAILAAPAAMIGILEIAKNRSSFLTQQGV